MSLSPWATMPSYAGYHHVLNRVMKYGMNQANARTGHSVRVAPHLKWKYSMMPDRYNGIPEAELPLAGLRKISLKTPAAELAWMLQGTRDIAWLQKHTKMWDQFTMDREVLENPQLEGLAGEKRVTVSEVEAAYGFRWRAAFGRDQIGMAVARLRSEPTDRQIHVGTWNPSIDGLGDPDSPKKNVPCITGFDAMVLGHVLHLSVNLRSSDVMVGLPYDMMTFALLCDAMALSIGVAPGIITLNLAHAHVYDVHWEKATAMLEDGFDERCHQNPLAPAWSLEAIAQDPDGYVANVAALKHNQTARFPTLEVIA